MIFIRNLVEIMFGCGLFINALLFIPQLIKLWKVKTSGSISLIMFLGFNTIQLFTVAHAYLHNDYILLIGTGLSLLTSGCVTVLAIVYKYTRDDFHLNKNKKII